MVTESELILIALALPDARQNGTKLEVKGKGFAWVYQEKISGRKGRVERRDVLAVRVASLEEKDALIAADPQKFFTDAHYAGFPAVLVRLAAIETDELTELLTDAWRIRAPRTLVKAFDAQEAAKVIVADSSKDA